MCLSLLTYLYCACYLWLKLGPQYIMCNTYFCGLPASLSPLMVANAIIYFSFTADNCIYHHMGDNATLGMDISHSIQCQEIAGRDEVRYLWLLSFMLFFTDWWWLGLFRVLKPGLSGSSFKSWSFIFELAYSKNEHVFTLKEIFLINFNIPNRCKMVMFTKKRYHMTWNKT